MAAPKVAVGPKSDKLWRNAIMLAVHRLSNDGKTKHLDILAHRLVKSAAEGDIAALREIGDRLDGKSVPVMDFEGGDNRLIINILQLATGATGATDEPPTVTINRLSDA